MAERRRLDCRVTNRPAGLGFTPTTLRLTNRRSEVGWPISIPSFAELEPVVAPSAANAPEFDPGVAHPHRMLIHSPPSIPSHPHPTGTSHTSYKKKKQQKPENISTLGEPAAALHRRNLLRCVYRPRRTRDTDGRCPEHHSDPDLKTQIKAVFGFSMKKFS